MSKVGIIAGAGNLPVLIASEAMKNKFEVFCAAIEGFADEKIRKYSTICESFKLGKIQAPIDFFKKNGVEEVILIGNIPHVNIFKDIKPDIRAAALLVTLKDKSAMGIFKAISSELKKDGLKPADTSMFLKDSLAGKGLLAGGKVSQRVYEDLLFAMDIASKIADMDIGLSVAVKEKAVIAVEAMEGTDECIKRAGKILSAGGFVIGKAARPDQDFCFDLPVIGENTIENMAASKAVALGVSAGKTLIVNKMDTLNLATKKGISIVGF